MKDMKKFITFGFILAALFITAACGEKDGPHLSTVLSSDSGDPLSTSGLNDIVVRVESQNVNGVFLDGYGGSEEDGVPDIIVFPPQCADPASPLAAGCGFSPAEVRAGIDLEGVPLGYFYKIVMVGRDKSGGTLFTGQTTTFEFSKLTTVIPPVRVE